MSVYFIRVGGYFKIGASDNPRRRFERLHRGGTRYTFPPDVSLDPDDRELYRVVEGWKEREHIIHRALDNFAVGLEWFLDEEPVREFIDALPLDEPARLTLLPEVPRYGGWCGLEFEAVQQGRAEREVARYLAGRSS